MSPYRNRHYTSVDKRTYNCEPNLAPPVQKPSKINLMLVQEGVSASDIYRIECFLESEEPAQHFSNTVLQRKERQRIVKEYALTKRSNNRWQGDEEEIFKKICNRWPKAENYKTYKNLLYAIRYGTAPVTIIQPEQNESNK